MIVITRATCRVDAYDSNGNHKGERSDIAASVLAQWQNRNLSSVNGMGEWESVSKGYAYNPYSEPLPDLQTRNGTFVVSETRVSNPKFKERMAGGEVVVSPRLIDRITIVEQQTLHAVDGSERHSTVDQSTPVYYQDPWIGDLITSSGLVYSTWPYLNRPRPSDGNGLWFNVVIDFYTTDSFTAVWPESADWELITRPFAGFVVDRPFLQGVVADAYSKGVDALTALAEGPETISYIRDALRTAGNLMVNHKARVKLLKDAFARKGELIKKASSIKLANLMALPSKSTRDISRRNRMIANARKDLVRDLNRNTADSVSAVASAWLQFRYAIMPNVYLVRDIIKAAKLLGVTRVTTNKGFTQALDLPTLDGWSVTGLRQRRHNAWCQLVMDVVSPLSKLRGVASFDIFVTAWELVPLSFVADWFLTVGNSLAVLTPPSGVTSWGVTYSVKDETSLTFISKNGGKTTVLRESYMRSIQSTEDFSGIYINVELNWKRVLDSMALVWSMDLKHRFRF